MFNFLDYTKNKIDYVGFKKLPNSGVFKVKLRSVKKKNFLKKNKKKVFKKYLPNFKKVNTFVQNNLSRSDVFLVRSFIWFKFRSLQKYILKKKSLKRKRRRLITQRIFLKQGSFKLKRFSSYSYLRSILKRWFYFKKAVSSTNWFRNYPRGYVLKRFFFKKNNWKSLKKFRVFFKKMKIKKKRYKFRLKKIRHVKRKLILQNLNKKIRNISYTNRLNQSSSAALNNVFKKNYHHAVSSLLKKTNLLDPEYILKNKSFVLGSLDPKTLKNTIKLTRKGLKVLNFIKRFKKHNDIFTFEEKINFFIKSKSNVFLYKSINKNKKNFFFKKRNKIRITGYFSSEKFSKKIYNLMPRFSNKSFERLSLKWLRKKKKLLFLKKNINNRLFFTNNNDVLKSNKFFFFKPKKKSVCLIEFITQNMSGNLKYFSVPLMFGLDVDYKIKYIKFFRKFIDLFFFFNSLYPKSYRNRFLKKNKFGIVYGITYLVFFKTFFYLNSILAHFFRYSKYTQHKFILLVFRKLLNSNFSNFFRTYNFYGYQILFFGKFSGFGGSKKKKFRLHLGNTSSNSNKCKVYHTLNEYYTQHGRIGSKCKVSVVV